MADFPKAYAKLGVIEGNHKHLGYVPPETTTDDGKETLGGRSRLMKIERAYRPKAADIRLFEALDILKAQPNFPSNLDGNSAMETMIKKAYELDEWAGIKGDWVPDQELAFELLEFAVHTSPRVSVGCAQYVSNLLNYEGELFPNMGRKDIMMGKLEGRELWWEAGDGGLGPITKERIEILLDRGDLDHLLGYFNVHQGRYYMIRMALREDQEANIRGYGRRLKRVGV